MTHIAPVNYHTSLYTTLTILPNISAKYKNKTVLSFSLL